VNIQFSTMCFIPRPAWKQYLVTWWNTTPTAPLHDGESGKLLPANSRRRNLIDAGHTRSETSYVSIATTQFHYCEVSPTTSSRDARVEQKCLRNTALYGNPVIINIICDRVPRRKDAWIATDCCLAEGQQLTCAQSEQPGGHMARLTAGFGQKQAAVETYLRDQCPLLDGRLHTNDILNPW